jgi:membrane-bound lytic murein transglycosylase F
MMLMFYSYRMTRTLRYLTFPPLLLVLSACSNEASSQLEHVKERGKLIVVTRNAATTYYEGPEGPTGLEYELLKGFADELGVELQLVVAPNPQTILSLLAEGAADLGAAGLTATKPREVWLRFSRPYQHIHSQLIYRTGTPRPGDPGEIAGHLEILTDSSHEEALLHLRNAYPELNWHSNPRVDSEELLAMVWHKQIDYTIADSNEFVINQRFMPELRVAFDLGEPQPLGWAFPRFHDESLYLAANDYLQRMEESGALAQLLERYYGHLENFDYVGIRIFMRHINERLPQYRALFELSAREIDLDWRLLAAAAYQESHWDPDAVSPTGVRGIMMLTHNTARELGLNNRTDPVESIHGGARYLSQLHARIPERIQEPDRSWLALAAYNIGFGHMEDARVLTQRNGGNPDRWKDVKQRLPLLHQRKWHSQTRFGYARGKEALQYVENIRSYYDILVWLTDQQEKSNQAPPMPLHPAMLVNSPAL